MFFDENKMFFFSETQLNFLFHLPAAPLYFLLVGTQCFTTDFTSRWRKAFLDSKKVWHLLFRLGWFVIWLENAFDLATVVLAGLKMPRSRSDWVGGWGHLSETMCGWVYGSRSTWIPGPRVLTGTVTTIINRSRVPSVVMWLNGTSTESLWRLWTNIRGRHRDSLRSSSSLLHSFTSLRWHAGMWGWGRRCLHWLMLNTIMKQKEAVCSISAPTGGGSS